MGATEKSSTPLADAPTAVQPEQDAVAKLRNRPRYHRDVRYDESSVREEVTLTSSTCFRVTFTNDTNLKHVTFDNCVLIDVKFQDCNLSDTVFRNVHLEDVVFEACSFRDAVWENVEMVDTDVAGFTYDRKEHHEFVVPRVVEDPASLREHLRSYVAPSGLDGRNLAELPPLEAKYEQRDAEVPRLTCDAGTMTTMPATKDAASATKGCLEPGLVASGAAPACCEELDGTAAETTIPAREAKLPTPQVSREVSEPPEPSLDHSTTPMTASCASRPSPLSRLLATLSCGQKIKPIADVVISTLDAAVPSHEPSLASNTFTTPPTSVADLEEAVSNIEDVTELPDVPEKDAEDDAERVVVCSEVSPTAEFHVEEEQQHGNRLFRFMDLPKKIRLKVYQVVLAPSSIAILDVPVTHSLARGLGRRLRYPLCLGDYEYADENGPDHTYISTGSDIEKGTGIKTAILRVSKSIHGEALDVLYGQSISFHCSAQEALSFLHDISKNLQLVKSLEFRYRYGFDFGPGPHGLWINFPDTHTQDWEFRRFMNCVVHKCSGLRVFRLRADKDIYENISWNTELPRGFLDKLQNDPGFFFFKQIARLPTYNISRNDGVRVVFNTARDHEDDKQKRKLKQSFIGQMRRTVDTLRENRPRDLAVTRPCNCGKTTYRYCCYVDLPYEEKKKSRFGDAYGNDT